ncbi:hypothetical protein DNF23_57250 [Pseudomonas syringae pv. pisi]
MRDGRLLRYNVQSSIAYAPSQAQLNQCLHKHQLTHHRQMVPTLLPTFMVESIVDPESETVV